MEHRIVKVEHWTPYGVAYGQGERMCMLQFKYGDEKHKMMAGRKDDETQVIHQDELSSTEMDEEVMERMAREFVENCLPYLYENS